MTVMVKVRQPKTMPYFWARGMSRRPKAARMSVGELRDDMVEKAWRSLSRSESSPTTGVAVVDAMVWMKKFYGIGIFRGNRKENEEGVRRRIIERRCPVFKNVPTSLGFVVFRQQSNSIRSLYFTISIQSSLSDSNQRALYNNIYTIMDTVFGVAYNGGGA